MRLITLLICTIITSSLSAQIRINRALDFNPLQEQIDSSNRLLGSLLYSVEPAHGWYSYNDEQTWTIRNQAFIELYRWKNDKLIGLYLGQELQANPFNEIYFNPRAAFWNESLLYQHKLARSNIKFGFNHRCRHNIDNVDPPRPEDSTTYLGESRVIVLTAITFGFARESLNLSNNITLQLFGQAFYYLYTEDSRKPIRDAGISWEKMHSSINSGYRLDMELSKRLAIYHRSTLDYIIFQSENNQFNYRVEGGINLKGDMANLSLFTAWEYFFDESNQIIPQSSELLQLGIRYSSPFMF